MATIIRKEERDFQPNPGKIDKFRLQTDAARDKHGVQSEYLNFDIRQLDPGQYNAAYHFHRYAEELFFILTGSVTLRTPDGLEVVNDGDMLFFEAGESGAHQLIIIPTRPVHTLISALISVMTSANIPIRTR